MILAGMIGSALKIIADQTGGDSYCGARYSFEGVLVPRIIYDDDDKMPSPFAGGIFAETRKCHKPTNLCDLANDLLVNQPSIFAYFLDGTRRTYKIDDIKYSNKIYPIIAGQVAVGWNHRKDKEIIGADCKHHLVICLPDSADAAGNIKRFRSKIESLRSDLNEALNGKACIERIILYKTALNSGEKLEDKAIAKVHEHMLQLEKEMVQDLAKARKLSTEQFLIKDGSLEYRKVGKSNPFSDFNRIKGNYEHVVGVSKSFNPQAILAQSKLKDQGSIASLPAFSRTPVFRYVNPYNSDIAYGVWYVRIRNSSLGDYSPFSGVLKLEKILITDDEITYGLDSDQVDTITAHIINERNPVCFGSDNRWANHLYPIYLTETFLKRKLYSTEYFTNIF